MIRYIRRFTGTKKIADYVVVMQQMGSDNNWHDLTPEIATWETMDDAVKFNKAKDYEFRNQPR